MSCESERGNVIGGEGGEDVREKWVSKVVVVRNLNEWMQLGRRLRE